MGFSVLPLVQWSRLRLPGLAIPALLLNMAAVGTSALRPETATKLLGYTCVVAQEQPLAAGWLSSSEVERLIGPLDYLTQLAWLLSGFLIAEWLYHSESRPFRIAGIWGWFLLLIFTLTFGYVYVRNSPEMFRLILVSPALYGLLWVAVAVALAWPCRSGP